MLIKKIISLLVAETSLPQDSTLLDVRSKSECNNGIIEGSINIPIAELQQNHPQLTSLDKTKPIVIYCASGIRAIRGKKLLETMQFEQVINGGGISNVAHKLHKQIK